MAHHYSLAIFQGNVVRDPKTISKPGADTTVVALTIANSRSKKVSGEWTEETLFIECTFFGKTADNVANKVVKGNLVLVQGAVGLNTYTANDGTSRTNLVCKADNFTLLPKPERKAAEEEAPF